MNNGNISIAPSLRAGLVEEYYFSSKLKQIASMRSNGINVINLGIGSPDMAPSEEVTGTLASVASMPGSHGYQSYNGTPDLRKAFSEWYLKWFRTHLDPSSEILPLIGSKEGIMHISMAFLNPGDQVLVPDPGYPAYAAATKLAGGVPKYYDLTEENGWLPDPDKLEKSDLSGVKIMWINYPHMPTGTKASHDLFSRIINMARRHRILVVNDNPYSFILNDEHLSLLSVDGSRGYALELNSLSKSHNMAGWRVGMVAGDPALIDAVVRVKSNMDSGMFLAVQAAAAKALQAPPEWYAELNRVYEGRRRAAADIFRLMQCTFDAGQTGLFLWGRIPEGYADAVEMTEKILNDAHVFITPGTIFGRNGKNYVRLSLCATEETFMEARARIERVL